MLIIEGINGSNTIVGNKSWPDGSMHIIRTLMSVPIGDLGEHRLCSTSYLSKGYPVTNIKILSIVSGC